MQPEVIGRKEWSRKLYEKHPYPDNYVDKSFLEYKKINGRHIFFNFKKSKIYFISLFSKLMLEFIPIGVAYFIQD